MVFFSQRELVLAAGRRKLPNCGHTGKAERL